jgi:Na+-driven multidrug efflux pump
MNGYNAMHSGPARRWRNRVIVALFTGVIVLFATALFNLGVLFSGYRVKEQMLEDPFARMNLWGLPCVWVFGDLLGRQDDPRVQLKNTSILFMGGSAGWGLCAFFTSLLIMEIVTSIWRAKSKGEAQKDNERFFQP